MTIGYIGSADIFHLDPECFLLDGPPRRIPESKALKWDCSHCPECV